MDQQTYDIIGAALEVHKSLGPGFLEAVYKEALSIELAERGIQFSTEAEIPVFFKGKKLKTCYRSDFICQDSIIVELKAISKLGDIETASTRVCYLTSARRVSNNGGLSCHRVRHRIRT